LFSTGQSARVPRPTKFKHIDHGLPKTQPPTWRGVGEEESRPTTWGGACPGFVAKTTRQPRQVHQRARAPWAVGRFSTGRSACEPRSLRFGSYGHDVSKPQPPSMLSVAEEKPRPMMWGGAHPALAAKTTTPSPPARTCSVGCRLGFHGAKRAWAAHHRIRQLSLRHSEAAAADLARCR